MKYIKKIKIATLIFFFTFINLFYFSVAAAQTFSFPNPIKQQSLMDLVNAILEVVVQFGAVLAVFFLIYSGFLFVSARGNPGAIQKAQQTFFYTIIGGLIVLGAFVISEIIANTADSFGVSIK